VATNCVSVHRIYIALEPSLDGKEPTAFKAVVLSFFAAFAPLREIFRVLIAAPPRWASVVNTSSQEGWNNLNENSTVT
jgi:hypothetical protein